MGYISKEEYREQINQIISILDGKLDNIIKELEQEMNEASKNMEFEKAAYIRDKKLAIERIGEKQKVSNRGKWATDGRKRRKTVSPRLVLAPM